MTTPIFTKLPAVTTSQRARILEATRTIATHRELLAEIPAMNAVQLGGAPSCSSLGSEFTVAAWNVERCLFPRATAAHLAPLSPSIVLLSEVDDGMARSAQRHTTQELAEALGMQFAFGVEFYELGLGGVTERAFCVDDFNTRGWHGNAILSSVPFERVIQIRLDDHGHWFAGDNDPHQPRLGGRMAIGAVVPTKTGPICVVSTHLESNADAQHRQAQFEILLDGIDRFAPDMPVLIGGDLNTGNHMPPGFDWHNETLFDLGRERGYSWDFNGEGTTTRPSLISPHVDRKMKLDWFAGRDLSCKNKGVLSSKPKSQPALSDHDCIWCNLTI